MIAELNRITPYMRSRIRQHDIMLIRYADTRDLEGRCFAFRPHTVELVEGLVVIHERRVYTGALVTGNIRWESIQIVLRLQFRILHIRHAVVRPAGRGGEYTRPCIVGYDGDGVLKRSRRVFVIQTQIHIIRRRKIAIEE